MPIFIELPPAVARRFVEDMRAFHAEPNAIKRDEIAARQLHGLKQHYSGKLRLTDVKETFEQMRDHAWSAHRAGLTRSHQRGFQRSSPRLGGAEIQQS
jgi:hypothetical protein